MARFLHDLLDGWKRPDVTVGRAKTAEARVWLDPTSQIDANAKFVGPVWIGAGRHIDGGATVIGPAIVWDDPAHRPALDSIRWLNIEPTEPDANNVNPKDATPIDRAAKRLFDILFSLAAANPNRDDSGSPKTLGYGGVTRSRIASQSMTRAKRRTFEADYLADATYRSVFIAKYISDVAEKLISDAGATVNAEQVELLRATAGKTISSLTAKADDGNGNRRATKKTSRRAAMIDGPGLSTDVALTRPARAEWGEMGGIGEEIAAVHGVGTRQIQHQVIRVRFHRFGRGRVFADDLVGGERRCAGSAIGDHEIDTEWHWQVRRFQSFGDRLNAVVRQAVIHDDAAVVG